MSVLFIIEHGICSEQTSIANRSIKPKEFDSALDLEFAEIYTLKPKYGLWEWDDGFPLSQRMFSQAASGSYSTEKRNSSSEGGGDIPISVFHEGKKAGLENKVIYEIPPK